ncbi:tetratricopeptide repeat protein [Corallococcus sp. M34]|uniref:tetratricopeptide repeat protein n=1 Tax=Citreicoccus inhibens TaxID=2849499 RepID=UPI001C226C36|nr:tetratricopeptide repeat protein [Citreicoccus inhibens]MBU8899840.1 tetratricopeptide repeat protein [Citreicoccus inhibens]
MDSSIVLPPPGGVLILEAVAGGARQAVSRSLLEQSVGVAQRAWMLDCHRDVGGPWAGLSTLLAGEVADLQRRAPELIHKHDYELALVVPDIRRDVVVRNPSLTDVSPEAERTRNYAADRAFRIPHGLVDLLERWHALTDAGSWLLVCEDFDHSGALIRQFFSDLMRRAGARMGVRLVVVVSPGALAATEAQFESVTHRRSLSLDLPADPPSPPVSPEAMARRARELASGVRDLTALENVLPRLIHCWRQSNEPKQALQLLLHALTIYSSRGFYDDALRYAQAALELLERLCPENVQDRLHIYNRMSNCYSALKQPHAGLAIVDQALASTTDPAYLISWSYVKAMYHGRYLPERDYALAERYLDQGMAHIERADLPLHKRLFRKAFNRNGLAMIRHFQKRHDEAIELCRNAFAELDAHLEPGEHLLHRSVLLYNVAQVYAAVGRLDEAIDMYSAAMRMDPNYSEYYNERGGLYLQAGRYEESERDLLRAIELSPPYLEVWTNLGQCYRHMGRPQDAAQAFTRALEFNPRVAQALSGRGHAYEALGQVELALKDYEVSLGLNPAQPLVHASRAVLRYEAGQLEAAVEDLNQAITLAPKMADLYQNRAVALRDLGRADEAARDWRMYLELSPEAPDRAEVEAQLATVLAHVAAPHAPAASRLSP